MKGIFFVLILLCTRLVNASESVSQGTLKRSHGVEEKGKETDPYSKKARQSIEFYSDSELESKSKENVDYSEESKVPVTPAEIPEISNFPSCFRDKSNLRHVSVTFGVPEVIKTPSNSSNDEVSYLQAILNKNLVKVCLFTMKGVLFSNSSTVFDTLSVILQSCTDHFDTIDFLIRLHPYVFITERYDQSLGSLFKGISLNHANCFLKTYPKHNYIRIEIFREYLIDSESKQLDFNYSTFGFETISQMIKLAQEQNRQDIVRQIILEAKNIKNQYTSILFEAIESKNLKQIEYFIEKPNVLRLIMTKIEAGLYADLDAIDFAIIIHDQGLDSSYSVLSTLMESLNYLNRDNSSKSIKLIISKFFEKCLNLKANDNEAILNKLKGVLEQVISLADTEIILFVRDIYLKNFNDSINLNEEIETETEIDSETDTE